MNESDIQLINIGMATMVAGDFMNGRGCSLEMFSTQLMAQSYFPTGCALHAGWVGGSGDQAARER